MSSQVVVVKHGQRGTDPVGKQMYGNDARAIGFDNLLAFAVPGLGEGRQLRERYNPVTMQARSREPVHPFHQRLGLVLEAEPVGEFQRGCDRFVGETALDRNAPEASGESSV